MSEKPPNKNTISSTYFQRNFGRVTRRVFTQHAHIIVERDGLPVFALIPLDDLVRLRGLDQPARKHSPGHQPKS